MLYRIGEFSKITGLSISNLRYYDEIDLLKPIEIDLFTGYRYYGKEQIDDVHLINELKEVGFSLDEIKNNWNNFDDNLFIKRKENLLKEIELKENNIKKVDELRSHINSGKINLSVKPVEYKQKYNKVKTLF